MAAWHRKIAAGTLAAVVLVFTGCGVDAEAETHALKSVVNMYLTGLQGENWAVAASAWSRMADPAIHSMNKVYYEALFGEADLQYRVEAFEILRLEADMAAVQTIHTIRRTGGEPFADERITTFYTFVRENGAWRILSSQESEKVEIPPASTPETQE